MVVFAWGLGVKVLGLPGVNDVAALDWEEVSASFGAELDSLKSQGQEALVSANATDPNLDLQTSLFLATKLVELDKALEANAISLEEHEHLRQKLLRDFSQSPQNGQQD